ncbi:hypothetical protein D9M70_633290 [compost metagenome]
MTSQLHLFTEHSLQGIVLQDEVVFQRAKDVQRQTCEKGCCTNVEENFDYPLKLRVGFDEGW